ncbi:MAG: HAD family hydrolase, partial [Hyphomicrobiaceae bacterium]
MISFYTSLTSRNHCASALVIVFLLWPVASAQATAEPLPSWNETATKKAIVAFVKAVTNKDSPKYVPPADRIATFDNDGTLWNEKPLYIHFFAVLDHIKKQIAADPSLKMRQPYKAIAEKDKTYFLDLYENNSFDTLVADLLAVPFGGMTSDDFEAWAQKWVAQWKHPKYKVGVHQLIYQPMVDLIRYLEANQFKVYIFTADEAAFLRLLSQKLYGLPPSQVHGTSVRLEYIVDKGKANLVRTYQTRYFANWAGKPRLIKQIVGKRPILAAGNSNGDLHMLQYTALGGGFSLLLHHTDGEREDKYDKHTDKVMPLAKKEGWTVIDMKNDWKIVFP